MVEIIRGVRFQPMAFSPRLKDLIITKFMTVGSIMWDSNFLNHLSLVDLKIATLLV